MLERRLERAEEEVELDQVADRATLLEMQGALEQVHVEESLGYYIVDLVSRDAKRAGRPGRVEPARVARAPQARARPRRALGPRLRDAGRREGGRRARARAPALSAAGALGRAAALGRHRPRAARRGADAGGPSSARRRVTRVGDREASRLSGARRAWACSAALALGRPELAALAAPFAFFAGVGARPRQAARAEGERRARPRAPARGPPRSTSSSSCPPTRRVAAPGALRRAAGGARRGGAEPDRVIRLAAGERRELEIPLRCVHWGTYEVGEVVWRARDTFGLLVFEGRAGELQPLKVYPRGETLQRLLRPLETQAFSGNQVARHRGEGIEFADLRPFTTGDRVRRVNWRATARRGEPWVNETHPERNTDVVLFLDTFAEARRDDLGTLDLGVRAAAALAAHYLQGEGPRRRRVVRRRPQLADGHVRDDAAVPDRGLAARRGDPPQLRLEGPRRDPDADAAAARARHRAQPAARRAGGRRAARPAGARLRPRRDRAVAVLLRPEGESETEQLAYRLWRLRRDALRSQYASLGVPIVEWREGVPLEAMVEEVRAFRRHARVVRV